MGRVLGVDIRHVPRRPPRTISADMSSMACSRFQKPKAKNDSSPEKCERTAKQIVAASDYCNDSEKLEEEMVFVGAGKISYSSWMYEAIFSCDCIPDGSAFAVAKHAVILNRVNGGLPSCLGSAHGLTIYPARTSQRGRFSRLAYRNDMSPAPQSENTVDVDGELGACAIGVLEMGEEVWAHEEMFFLPVVPKLDRMWPCVPNPALFWGLARALNNLPPKILVSGKLAKGFICPLYYLSVPTFGEESKETFLRTRQKQRSLYDPLFDPASLLVQPQFFGCDGIKDSNNFQAGLGIVFQPQDGWTAKTKLLELDRVRSELVTLFARQEQSRPITVIITRGAVRRRLVFSTVGGFRFSSSFEPSGTPLKTHSVTLHI
ncbi:protein ID [Gallid alphaherpesvirus 1]|uniref:ORF D protein n=2 Tax=Infectious laryngotracheitis virus TaxID=10386 RepID=O56875_ILTV|nr:protein ID [Gallid alphaherpesvirus 1]ADK89036.1 protein ID [Gallid alphaherpesvirus 1]ADK89040.1 protein ID [Gallid alphaherpesvirus 1]ADK89043.1 protein ID [Gallid alphaherpesvirus 1]ADK89047.1 protein ID [Gallid alphaherpesvirus 1]ADK89051.1 protein ID [Gallid alphaherpesvirus 1]